MFNLGLNIFNATGNSIDSTKMVCGNAMEAIGLRDCWIDSRRYSLWLKLMYDMIIAFAF